MMDPEIMALLGKAQAAPLGAAFKDLTDKVSKLAETTAGKLAPAFESLADPVAAFGKGLRTAADVAVTLVPKLGPLGAVVDSVTGQMESLANAATGWVRQLSPATTNALDLQLRNLQATLGQAFAPAMSTMITLVNHFAGVLSPLTQQLAPVLQHLVEVIGREFLDAVANIVDSIMGWVDALENMITIFEGFLDLWRGLRLVIESVREGLASMFGVVGGRESPAALFRDAMRDAAKVAILFAAQMLAAVGATKILDILIRNLGQGPPGAGGGALAAPQNVRTQDFASIAREMAVAAFQGGPGGAPLKAEDWLAKLVPMIEDIRDDKTDLLTLIKDGKVDLDSIDGTLKGPFSAVARNIEKVLQGDVVKIWAQGGILNVKWN